MKLSIKLAHIDIIMGINHTYQILDTRYMFKNGYWIKVLDLITKCVTTHFDFVENLRVPVKSVLNLNYNLKKNYPIIWIVCG